ncbi:hypothetical protein [Neptunomonas sp. XY-337]|uniref:hypothetical protein n=1 Tax=Neptunomonas sp. XY-337 TaxID=2561897 RepID=UPI0010AB114D|nr:hypothetical protein [Neptunomonas sp. XY-337]
MRALKLGLGIAMCSALPAHALVQAIVTPTTLTTFEGGTTVQYAVTLDDSPSVGETVTVTPSSTDVTEGTVSAALTFTAADFDVPKYVTVTPGASGDGNDGDVSYTVTNIVTATGGTASYNGASANSVSVTNQNVDGVATLTVSPSSGFRVIEGGAAQTITVSAGPDVTPTNDVTVNLSTVSGEVALSAASVTLTAGNGYSATFTITANDDAAVDGDLSFTVVTAAADSVDPAFDGFDPVDVVGIAEDDDTLPPPPVNAQSIPALGGLGLAALGLLLGGLGVTRLRK